jgi:short chain dehydrogenase
MQDTFATLIATGTSANIGGPLVVSLAAAGARVVCTDVQPDVTLRCTKTITASGGQAIPLSGDVTDPRRAEEVASRALAGALTFTKQWRKRWLRQDDSQHLQGLIHRGVAYASLPTSASQPARADLSTSLARRPETTVAFSVRQNQVAVARAPRGYPRESPRCR